MNLATVISRNRNVDEQRNSYIWSEFPGVARASGRLRREVLEAVLDEPPLVPLLDELEMQGDHLLLHLFDRGLEDADVGEQLLRLQRREERPSNVSDRRRRSQARPNQPRRGVRAYVGGEVGHVGERDGGAAQGALEDGVQRRLLLQHLAQPLHLRAGACIPGQGVRRAGKGIGGRAEGEERGSVTHVLLQLRPADRPGRRRLRLRREPLHRLSQRQRHGGWCRAELTLRLVAETVRSGEATPNQPAAAAGEARRGDGTGDVPLGLTASSLVRSSNFETHGRLLAGVEWGVELATRGGRAQVVDPPNPSEASLLGPHFHFHTWARPAHFGPCL